MSRDATDPQEQHQEALDGIDRQIKRANAHVDYLLHGGKLGFEYDRLPVPVRVYLSDLVPVRTVAQLEGRKRILLRHAPVINRHDRANCAGCGKPWVDCPDWRDATGQETSDG